MLTLSGNAIFLPHAMSLPLSQSCPVALYPSASGVVQFTVQMSLLIVVMVEWPKPDLDGEAKFLVRPVPCMFR